MQVLDRTGVGTLWSICKTKFALKDHSHNYLPLSGGTLTGDLLFSNSGTTFRQIRGTCGDNDFWRIGGGATGNNAGYMEIATADDGTEPIYVRQYSGTFSTITRTATLLDGSGNTSFPGTVAAAKFKGALEGNASTASNAATVNGHTVNANVPSNAKFTDTNTWRPIHDNLTSTSTSESLSANQGRVLKGLVDGKANSSHTHSWSQISGAPATATRWPSWGEVTGKPGSFTPSSHTHNWSQVTGKPDIKSWSEIKSYIDSKVDSENNYPSYSIQSYIQSQLKPFGLTCRTYPCYGVNKTGTKCGIFLFSNTSWGDDDIDNLFKNNSNIQPGRITKIIDSKICKEYNYENNYIYVRCIWNNYVITCELGDVQDSGKRDCYVIFFDTKTGASKKVIILNGTNNEVGSQFAVACTYNNLYVGNRKSLYVFDKSLNFTRYPNAVPYEIEYLYNYGDLGIFITYQNGNAFYYKDGVISQYTGSDNVNNLKYTKNRHEYNLRIGNCQLITDDFAIKYTGEKITLKRNTFENLIFYLIDLQNNVTIPITIPAELFNISISTNVQHKETSTPVIYSNNNTLDNKYSANYYVSVYKE